MRYLSPIPVGTVGAVPVITAKDVSVRALAGAVEVKIQFAGNHTVEILNMQGKVITRRSGSSAADYMISLDRHASAMYLVKVSGQGNSLVKKVML